MSSKIDRNRTVQPRVTVAIASFRPTHLLEACLESVGPQATAVDGAVVVVRRGVEEELSELRVRYPIVRFEAAPREFDVPELRGLAMERAEPGHVALTEDHCVARPGWLTSLLAGLEGSTRVVGGAMWNARADRALDWGAYFAEYGFFGPGAASLDPPLVTGANALYHADLVAEVAGWFGEGLWENVAHDRLRRRGVEFAFEPGAVIEQNQRYGLRDFCRDRFEHGLAFARDRLVEEGGGGRRWLYALGTPILPLILARRVAGAAGSNRPRTFVRAAPYTLGFLSAWAAGELAGYLGAKPRG